MQCSRQNNKTCTLIRLLGPARILKKTMGMEKQVWQCQWNLIYKTDRGFPGLKSQRGEPRTPHIDREMSNGNVYTLFSSRLQVSVQFSHSVVSNSLRPHESHHARLPCPSQTPRVYSNSCPSSRWCHPAILSSVVPFSSCPQSLPASGSFSTSQLFAWGGQSIEVSASASVLPMNIRDWSPLGWTGWISLLSKGLSRVFSNTTVQKHQFFGAQLTSQSNSHIHTWLLEKP